MSFYNRAASDDIYSIVQFKELGAFDLLSHYYFTWSGRWSTILYFTTLLNFSEPLSDFQYYIFLYYVITLVILLVSITFILQELCKRIFHALPEKKDVVILSILFTAAIYFFTFQATEVWWWVCSSFVYLQGIVALLLGIALLLKERKNILHKLLIILCFAYLGGSSEIYIISIFACMATTIIFLKYFLPQTLQSFLKGPYFKGVCLAAIVFTVSATVCLSAPGNRNRAERDFRTADKTVISEKNASDHQVQSLADLSKKYLFALAISSLAFLFGMKIRKQGYNVESIQRSKNGIILIFLLLLISIVVTWLFQILILKEARLPARAWTFSSLLLTIFFCFVFFSWGYRSNEKGRKILLFSVILPTLVLTMMILNVINQYKFTSNYAESYDHLMQELSEKKGTGESDTLFLQPLPDPGMLVSLYPQDKNISEGLETIMALPFKIRVKEEK